MDTTRGEILISPKTIYWIQTPVTIGEHDRIELLKRDILIINYNGDVQDIVKLKDVDNKYSAFFFNLDGILSRNHIKGEEVYSFTKKIGKFIGSFFQKRSLVYTTILDKNLAEVFKANNVYFVEKNLNDKKIAITTIFSLIHPFFAEDGKVQRSFLRLNLFPMKYKFVLVNLTKGNAVIEGIIKDLSLNGMGLVFANNDDLKNIAVKDVVEVKLFIKNSIIKINRAIVTRHEADKLEFGVNYNINDTKMVREDYASYLTGLIYNWIKEIIKEHGTLVKQS
jgi:hypothetical protein